MPVDELLIVEGVYIYMYYTIE